MFPGGTQESGSLKYPPISSRRLPAPAIQLHDGAVKLLRLLFAGYAGEHQPDLLIRPVLPGYALIIFHAPLPADTRENPLHAPAHDVHFSGFGRRGFSFTQIENAWIHGFFGRRASDLPPALPQIHASVILE